VKYGEEVFLLAWLGLSGDRIPIRGDEHSEDKAVAGDITLRVPVIPPVAGEGEDEVVGAAYKHIKGSDPRVVETEALIAEELSE
jgi:hypothetical protein